MRKWQRKINIREIEEDRFRKKYNYREKTRKK
jgi:hypothetical protein